MSESEQRVRAILTEPCDFGAVMLENGSFTKADLRALLADLDQARAALDRANAGLRLAGAGIVVPNEDAIAKALAADLARVTEERDDYRDQAKDYWRIGLNREKERNALAARLARCEGLLRECVAALDHETGTNEYGNLFARIDAYFTASKQEPRT